MPDSTVPIADHPRIRGEHCFLVVFTSGMPGSSPHTRGALVREGPVGDGTGIIPAYAGSTPPSRMKSPPTEDHPRIRGEHTIPPRPSPVNPGSSPHTRGAPFAPRGSSSIWRIIPAYAGSTAAQRDLLGAVGDHPRIRGEHGLCDLGPEARPGSSPHTRGAPRKVSARSPAPRDHPRIRGEHDETRQLIADGVGSSPHTRGARRAAARGHPRSRIIPAYAGSTPPSSSDASRGQDHPRIRGEHAS